MYLNCEAFTMWGTFKRENRIISLHRAGIRTYFHIHARVVIWAALTFMSSYESMASSIYFSFSFSQRSIVCIRWLSCKLCFNRYWCAYPNRIHASNFALKNTVGVACRWVFCSELLSIRSFGGAACAWTWCGSQRPQLARNVNVWKFVYEIYIWHLVGVNRSFKICNSYQNEYFPN